LAVVDAAVFDKTGTLTIGKPSLDRANVMPRFDRDTVLRYAGAVEQESSHLLARVLVDAVHADGLGIPRAVGATETPGHGVRGQVDGHDVRVGARAFVVPYCENGVMDAARLERDETTLRAYMSIDGELAGVFEYADRIRPELPAVLRALRNAGVRREVLLSGDHAPIARAVAATAGITETHGDLLPVEKASF